MPQIIVTAAVNDVPSITSGKPGSGREKDFEFARALLAANLIDTRTLRDRAEQLDGVPAAKRRVIEWIARTGT